DEISMRLTIPRRIKDRIRLIVSSQRRLRAGRLGALPRRDFFPDARTLFAIDASARGEELPEWASDPRMAEGSPTRRRHRRRRRGDRP
ncbi:MAG: hypothetical protein OEY14_09890, partial [Myxococcales bacterium]|nr:hypothetical protein [Myxococcales bacterium]